MVHIVLGGLEGLNLVYSRYFLFHFSCLADPFFVLGICFAVNSLDTFLEKVQGRVRIPLWLGADTYCDSLGQQVRRDLPPIEG